MLNKSNSIGLAALFMLAVPQCVFARTRWLERETRAVFLHPRRFGQERPAVIDKLGAACAGNVCGVLAGKAVNALLAAQPECSQQDVADEIITASKQFDPATQANMVELAQEYRQAEKNTPPDFATNPPTLRNSVFCQNAPKNPELNGLVQAQDPANDPDLFFDPATKATVRKGSQANTAPFSGAAAPGVSATTAASATAPDPQTSCVTEITITVSGTNPAATGAATTITAGDPVITAAPPKPTPPSGNIGDFGDCTIPEIEFGAGFDNRRETSFQPKDKASFNHGSAQNIDIITKFICDTLVNTCGADQTAKNTCATAQAAAASAVKGTGGQADAFNAAFGIATNFVDVTAIDNQGRPVPGTGKGNEAPATSVVNNSSSTPVSSAASAPTTAPNNGNNNEAIGDFGRCSVPEIEFGVGFDNRKETSFRPVDEASFSHGSAQGIAIITRFICDSLTNTCGADETAKATCARAQTAADAAAPKTGDQADAFNAVFGINTNFADVTPIDDQGRPVGATSIAPTTTENAQAVTTSTLTPRPTQSTGGAVAGNLQQFTSALGGVTAPSVAASQDGKFQVEGNSSFNDETNAVIRSCDVQNNKCADAANASGNKNGFTVAACNAQQAQCIATARSA